MSSSKGRFPGGGEGWGPNQVSPLIKGMEVRDKNQQRSFAVDLQLATATNGLRGNHIIGKGRQSVEAEDSVFQPQGLESHQQPVSLGEEPEPQMRPRPG